MIPGVEAPMTKRSLSSRMPINSGILLVSTINSGLVRPDRSCTRRSVPPASGLANPAAPARILTASSTLVGAAKFTVGMFAPESAHTFSRAAQEDGTAQTSRLHYHLMAREQLCSNVSGMERNPGNEDSHDEPWVEVR